MKRIFWFLPAAAMLFAACERELIPEPVETDPSLIPLNIDGSIDQVHTKATAAGFVDKDALGLFAVNYSKGNTVAGTLAASGNQADNVKYVFDEAAHKWNPVKSVYYKDINTNVDLYLYYPYQSSINDVNAAGFEVQKDQSTAATETALSGYEASDFLWGKTSGVVPTEAKVAVSLSHKMSAVNVTLVEKDGFEEGEFDSLEKSIILTNTTRKATVDYSTGEVTPLGGAQLDGIVMCPQESGAFRAVVVPQTLEAGVQLFAITIDGVSYSFKNSGAATVYQSGKQIDVTINISKKIPSGEYQLELGGMAITDWVEDRNTHGGEAKQYFVVTLTKPGTLGKTIKTARKNPDKIKNLKIAGPVNDRDFTFMRDSMAILEAVNMKESVLRCVDRENYSPTFVEFVGDKDNEYKQDLIDQYGEPNVITYSSGMEWDYSWYPEEAIGAIIPDGSFLGKSSLYYFVFPESVTKIGSYSFMNSNISGHLNFPNDVEIIGIQAFYSCKMITGITWPRSLSLICNSAFNNCPSLSGTIIFPERLKAIEPAAFGSTGITGVKFPESLEKIGGSAFANCSSITGSISIPEKVKCIPSHCFYSCKYLKSIYLNNVTEIEDWAFTFCGLQGELMIPEGTSEIGVYSFAHCELSTIVFPTSLKRIEKNAFYANSRLSQVTWSNGLMTIESDAFAGCANLLSIDLPSSIISIGTNAFAGCYGVSSFVCRATQVPNAMTGAFDGIPKDNFTLEVPENMVTRYQAASGWGEFRRIGGHYDFSISRNMMRGLNAEISNTYVLRAPSGFNWSIESKPDWVTVTPDHGTGKTDVTINFEEMPRTSEPMYNLDNVYEQIGTGRNGEIVFLLDDKDYRSTMRVEQYDSDYQDGQTMPIETAAKGNGIDIIYIGDGYDARDIATGKFLTDVTDGDNAFFGVEPYATYKDYFNVYAVVSMSKDSGIGTENTVVDTKFGSYFTQKRILAPNVDDCFSWASKAKSGINFSKSLVIMLQNASVYEGVTMMYGDGSAIACCPISDDAYPYDFRGIIQHEAGGHGFGKLADEYIYHGAFINNCDCMDCDHPHSDNDLNSSFGRFKSLGWYRNLSMETDMKNVPWSHLIYHNKYSDYVDIFEGGYMHSRGMFRSEATSCMNNNIPYFSAISRQAIVERIMDYAGEEFIFEKFVQNDSRAFGAATKKASVSVNSTEIKSDDRERNYPIYMGERPEFKR